MNDHHYAVVVGINRYPGLSDLTSARSDAEAFAGWLAQPDGGAVPTSNIAKVIPTDQQEATFSDTAVAQPVREQIEDALGDTAKAVRAAVRASPEVWGETRLYLYVAGHGLAPRGGEGALYLANAREDASRHLELAEYRKWCTRCAFVREVVVFADCCRTRESNVQTLLPTLDECASPLVEQQATWVVGFGSGLGDETYEDDARGYFTSALIDGLANAPPDDEGAITAATLGPHVKAAVAEQTKLMEHPQSAEFYADLGARVVFRTTPRNGPAVRKVTIRFPRRFKGVVELRRGVRLVGSHDASDGPWSLPLEEELYEIVPAAGQPSATFAENGLFKVLGGDRVVQL